MTGVRATPRVMGPPGTGGQQLLKGTLMLLDLLNHHAPSLDRLLATEWLESCAQIPEPDVLSCAAEALREAARLKLPEVSQLAREVQRDLARTRNFQPAPIQG